jgi:hypothetical protein
MMTNSNDVAQTPEFRHHNIKNVIQRRDRLMKAVAPRYAGVKLEGPIFGVFVQDVHEQLPSSCSVGPVAQSLFEFVGSSPEPKELFDCFWRLAANMRTLQEGVPVHPWSEQPCLEWVPVQILHVQVDRRLGKVVYGITGQILSGRSCPWRTHQYWSPRKVFYLAKHRDEQGNGFMFSRGVGGRSRRSPKYLFESANQLAGLRFLALIDPDRCDGGPGFQEIRFTSSISSYNRELIRRRARIEDSYDCPKGYSNVDLCHNCHYGRDECEMACHAKTFTVDFCPSCKSQAYFDSQDDHTTFCVNCTDRKRKRGDS